MKNLRPDDPRYTAYALGESSPREAKVIEESADMDHGLEDELARTQALGKLLCEAYEREGLSLRPSQRAVIRMVTQSLQVQTLASARRGQDWLRGLTFSAAAIGIVAASLYLMSKTPTSTVQPELATQKMDMEMVLRPATVSWWPSEGVEVSVEMESSSASEQPEQTFANEVLNDPQRYFASAELSAKESALPGEEVFPPLRENHYLSSKQVTSHPVPVIAGRTSFSWVERYLNEQGQLPPKDAVRLEELVNYPDYRESHQVAASGVSLTSELVPSPWNEGCLLLGILMQRDSEIAKDAQMALRLDVDQDFVDSIRLLGFARPDGELLETADTERPLAAGNSTFVIYEVKPRTKVNDAELMGKLALKVTTRGTAEYQSLKLSAKPRRWLESSDSFRTAATVAAYALVLRDSSYKGDLSLARVESLARQTLLDLEKPNRETREVLNLIVNTRRLAGLIGTAQLERELLPTS